MKKLMYLYNLTGEKLMKERIYNLQKYEYCSLYKRVRYNIKYIIIY